MKICDYTHAGLVVRDLDAAGMGDAIHALVQKAVEAHLLKDGEAVAKALIEREAAHATALPSGVAVPHAASSDIAETCMLVGVAPRGCSWGTASPVPVVLILLLLSPPERGSLHIKLLARIARLAMHPGFADGIVGAATDQAVLDALAHAEAHHV